MFVSLVVIGLYFLPYFISLGSIGDALIVHDIGALLAGLTLIWSFALYLWIPKSHRFLSSLSVYALTVLTVAYLVISTGGVHSSFIALWIALTVFASVFGLWGLVILGVSVITYITYLMMSPIPEQAESVIAVSILGVTPLIASFIMFHSKNQAAANRAGNDTAYHELASELSSVTSKSEVVIRAIDDGVLALDNKGNIELMNPAAQRIIGWGNQDANGLNYQSVLKLFDEKDQSLTETSDPILQVLNTNKEVYTKKIMAATASNKHINLSLIVSPIGQIGQGVIVAFRDITRERAEEREQAEFISTASHEMRTPVASIEGYLGLALNPNTAQIDEKARDYIEKAHASAQHLGRLFQDLLDVSKADDGRLSNHPNVVDLVDYLGDIVEGLQSKAKEKGLRLFYKPNPSAANENERTLAPVFYANVDNDHLRELVANLVENGIKYTPKGDVIVDVSGDEERVRISVQDSGIGIPKEDIPHLFQKFYRVDNSATREIGGTGLGLYLCRRLAEIMGGRMLVDSEFGKGSTFTLELPRISREEALQLLDAATTTITPDEAAPLMQAEAQPPQVQPAPQPQPTQAVPQQPAVVAPVASQPQQPMQPQPTQQQYIQQPSAQPQPTLQEIEQGVRPSANIQVPSRGQGQPPQA